MHKSTLIIGLFTTILAAQAANAEVQGKCYPAEDVAKVAESFPQVKEKLNGNQPVCESAVGNQWSLIIETLVDMKNIKLSDAKEFKTKDDFSFKAIPDNGWWKYLTERASNIEIQADCRPGVVAYVHPFFFGTVNLCAPFFKQDRVSRAEVMLHEVRHFDGFGHVTCTQGNEKDLPGACDNSLQEAGSYAVSMQANITMGLRGSTFTPGERALGRAGALYLLHNRFNAGTTVKVKQSYYVENVEGKIFEWDPSTSQELRLVKELASPARIHSYSTETILYPLDKDQKAFRMAEDMTLEVPRLGMYAEYYNGKSSNDRKSFKSVSYNANGGVLTEEGFSSICGQPSLSTLPMSSLPEVMETQITVADSFKGLKDYLVGASGKLYSAECVRETEQKVYPTAMVVPQNLEKAIYVSGQGVALTKQGQIQELTKVGNDFALGKGFTFDGVNNQWIDIAVRTMPYLFEEALGN